MLIDITLKITPKMAKDARGNEKKALTGHLGTHFDVMDKEFPLAYTRRKGIVFDVSSVCDREIGLADISAERIEPEMFVAFYTGFIEKEPYGTAAYFHRHPQLSGELIEALLTAGVSIIGIDFAGLRRGKAHTPTDRYCAEQGTFVVENLCNLQAVIAAGGRFTARTFPMNYVQMSGLPCRVVAEIE